MRFWKSLTFGRACAHVAAFSLLLAVVKALLRPSAAPDEAFWLVVGYGLALLPILAFRQRGAGVSRVTMQAAGLVALTFVSAFVSVAVLGALL
ncbi:hypothetical protein [uncultured Caulobacter sp.]|uniref:hypothetical protein n=1 Tax=uncultured Caulobacter sp. TaxID=158749 RepID=UPI0026261E44|nr:hypothetical protein [uncultured Caulobacter sp.]